MKLTEAAVANLKPLNKSFKRSDGGGLYLLVKTNGTRVWRLDYRFQDLRKTLTIGKYPDVSLAAAREAREDAKKLLPRGIDPGVRKKQAKAEAWAAKLPNDFGSIADEFLAKMVRERRSPRTVTKVRWHLKKLAKPLSDIPIAEIRSFDVLATLRKVEARGLHDSAHETKGSIGRVFRYAIATLRCEKDPTIVLHGALDQHTAKSFAAITEPARVGALMRAINGYHGWATITAALKIQAYCFQRPGETRLMEWSELNLDRAIWTIPATKMKMRRNHDVPLSRQAIQVLRSMREISRGGRYVFQSKAYRKEVISENAMNSALHNMGFLSEEHTPHGFRSTASSLLNESMLFHPDAIEVQLAHLDRNSIRRIYNRAPYWDERVRMMQWWADFLDAWAVEGMSRPTEVAPELSFRQRLTW